MINLDVNNPDLKAGVMALPDLQIQHHAEYLAMLKENSHFGPGVPDAGCGS